MGNEVVRGKCPRPHAAEQTGRIKKMLISSSLKWTETEVTFHVLTISFLSPEKTMKISGFLLAMG